MTMSDQTETGLTTDTIAVTSGGEPPTTSSTASSDTSIDTSGYVSSASTASPQSSASVNGGTGSDCGSVDCGGSTSKLTDFATSTNSGQKVNNNNCDASSTSAGNGNTQKNGKLSPAEGITNGVAPEQASSPTHFVSHPAQGHSVSQTPQLAYMSKVGGGTPNILHQPSTLPRGHSPHRYSPNTPHSRGNSPQNQRASPQSQQQSPQHIVLVHVNPGETFSVRVGEQIQHIQGPATVRMVSNNGPPLPMPMQVPPGHMVQQIVDENGILTHVILSPQPPGMAAPPMTVGYYGGPNGTLQHMYPAYGPQYPAYPTQYGAHPHPHPTHPHIHAPMPPPPGVHHTPPPHQCNSTHNIHPPAGPPPAHHPNHSPRGDERAHRQRQKLQDKIQRRNLDVYHNQNHIPASPGGGPRRTKPKVNGDVGGRRTVDTIGSGSSSSTDGNELEEERKTIRELLSKMKLPKVSDVEARSALIQLTAPECNQQEFDIDPSEFKYELQLSEKKDGKDGKYKSVYSGDATEITLKDLRPAAEYHLKVSSILDDLKGDATDPVSFKTLSCEPDAPLPPKLNNRTKTSLLLKWNATPDNGAKISSYTLEFDQGRGDMNFVEIYNGLQRQFKVTKLSTSTGYTFRLAAINAVGKSEFSEPACYVTSGSVPSQPDPPMLSEPFVKALTISWIKRPNDDEFTLQMEDEATGHGFLTVYNGSNLSYKIKNLRRNTEYKYRLQACNEEGPSRWSDVVMYRTLPDRPGPPNKPSVKGKIHAYSFRIVWDGPKDNGGTDITKYLVELDNGRGPEVVYEGTEKEYACDHLEPGQTFRMRAACIGPGGQSEWSDHLVVTTQAVAPGQCQPPKMQGKPRATSLHLRWLAPSYDGGSPVTEFEVQMTGPDNTTREVYKGRDLDCTVAGLLPGRPYLFQARAVNRAGAGPWSDILEVLSGAGVPDPPKTPVVHCKSPHSAIIQWEEPVNNGATITEYRLEWQQRVEGEFSQIFFGPALSFDVKGLQPATLYNFRVQALNSAGAGPFSGTASCTTPPSSPGAVVSLKASATANSIHLTWREPPSNGSKILSYNIDIGERHLITAENILDHVIEDLIPETTYKIRVQAVNGIGVGAFSSLIKVTTHSLPPNPPRLECVSSGPNSLKLKWGDGKNLDLLQYCLEMLRDNGSFYPIYHGTGHSHKVNKLSELMDYEFRINASNEAGDGSYSEVFRFRTTIAPPPAVKAPRIEKLEETSCVVEWPACKPMGKDSIIYILQIQSLSDREQEYKQLYKGAETSYRLTNLSCQSEHQVRVCAVRLCTDGSADLTGAFSPGVSFTMPVKPTASESASSSVSPARASENRQLSDQQWAMIILLGFALCAILIAFLAQKIIAYTSGSSSVESSGHSMSQGSEAGLP